MPLTDPRSSLHQMLLNRVAATPEKPAIFWGPDQLTFDRLRRMALGVAGELAGRHGIRPGDRVGLWLKNRPEFVAAYYGILMAGAVVVPINNFLKPTEIEHILTDADIRVVISEEELITSAASLQQTRPQTRFISVIHFVEGPPGSPVERASSDLAAIVYTSGTTGRSKGAMLSHGNLLHNVASCEVVLEVIQGDRIAVMLPLFHSFMMTVGMILPLTLGGSMVLVRSLHPPKNALLEIVRHQATILPAVPPFFRALAGAGLQDQLPLRICISGGAPLPGEILREFEAKMPVPLIEGYGLSEASPVVSLNPIRGERKAGSIGLPIRGVEMAVWNEAGDPLPDGETGEIVVRGGNVMQGYWNQSEATSQSIRNGWLLTGDIGRRDADGYYYITDRKKDMLLVNGINVYPREIEEVIYQFPGIREAAVIGRPDSRRGEQAVAFYAVAEGATVNAGELGAFVRSRLADFKVPRRFIELPALPRNATGKILKTTLRDHPLPA